MAAELPAVQNLVALLETCRQKKNLALAKRIHGYMSDHRLASHQVLGSHLVSVLVDCGNLCDARQVFDGLLHQSEHLWCSLISGYVNSGEIHQAFCMYMKMGNYIRPSSQTYVSLLGACASLKELERCHIVHTEVIKDGLEESDFVGNSMVDMYGKCGSLADARDVLDKLSSMNTVSWNALIAGYAEYGLVGEAMNSFQQMQSKGISPNEVTLVCSLKACVNCAYAASSKDREAGLVLHAETLKRGLDRDLLIGNTLINLYGNCSLLAEAQKVFSQLPNRTVVSWTALIGGYAEHGLGKEAWNCFDEMQKEGICPDDVTFVCSLKACGDFKTLEAGQILHNEIVRRGLESHTSVANIVVDMYAKCGFLAEAQLLLCQLPDRNVVPWTAMLSAYAEHGATDEVLRCFNQMQLEGISPDADNFVCSLKACSSTGTIERGRELHAEITKRSLEREPYVGTTLVSMYAKYGSLVEAKKLFDELPSQTIVQWAAVIAGYVESRCDDEALKFFEQMQVGGISPDASTCACTLRSCASIGALETGQYVHVEIVKLGFERDHHVRSTLVDMYSKCGALMEACGSFDALSDQCVVPWTALIAGYAEYGLCNELLDCLRRMQVEGVPPDANTLACCLKACGRKGAVERGQQLHIQAVESGMEREPYVCTTLVDMYAKLGLLVDAYEVFQQLPARNVVQWTALMSGCAEKRFDDDVLSCFAQMQLDCVSLDVNFCSSSLKACSTLGDVETGQALYAEMTKVGLEREPYVGNTLVDMYAKCGMLADARIVFDKLSLRDAVSWNALVAGYADSGFGIESLECFKQMQLEGVSPVAVTFSCSLKACTIARLLEMGQVLHAAVVKLGVEKEFDVGDGLVEMYAKCGVLLEARKVFEGLSRRGVVSWGALMSGYAESGHVEVVLDFLEQMQIAGVCMDVITLVACLKVCGIIGLLERGQALHSEGAKLGLESHCIVGNVLVDMYSTCAWLAEGQDTFEKMPVRDVVSWNSMIKGYGENHQVKMAVRCFEEMQEQGVKPDMITFTCVLVACSHANLVLEGQKYFKLMEEQYNFEPNINHITCMVDLLARSGHVYEAKRFASAKQCSTSEEILRILLTACKVYGKVELGFTCFQQIVEVNREEATPYLLMADIYASAGMLSDASRIEKMRIKAGAAVKKLQIG